MRLARGRKSKARPSTTLGSLRSQALRRWRATDPCEGASVSWSKEATRFEGRAPACRQCRPRIGRSLLRPGWLAARLAHIVGRLGGTQRFVKEGERRVYGRSLLFPQHMLAASAHIAPPRRRLAAPSRGCGVAPPASALGACVDTHIPQTPSAAAELQRHGGSSSALRARPHMCWIRLASRGAERQVVAQSARCGRLAVGVDGPLGHAAAHPGLGARWSVLPRPTPWRLWRHRCEGWWQEPLRTSGVVRCVV